MEKSAPELSTEDLIPIYKELDKIESRLYALSELIGGPSVEPQLKHIKPMFAELIASRTAGISEQVEFDQANDTGE